MNNRLILGVLPLMYVGNAYSATNDSKPLNVVLITADDLNYTSVGYMGCPIPNTTPNLDKLASEGIVFNNAYVNVAVSQPSRAVLATGMYSHNNGVEGFAPSKKDIQTLMSVLNGAGYQTGVAGKASHSTPIASYKWDMRWDMSRKEVDLGNGRDPKRYYEVFNEFVTKAQDDGKPFYFMANSHDPHAPFHGSDREKTYFSDKQFPSASYVFTPEEMVVPGFLSDLPETRIELAQYYSSVRRLDDTVGEILRVLKEHSIEDNTIVMFLSDHGMDFPFAKTNCYMNSNKTPWVVKWPGVVEAGSVDDKHFISAIDFMPTVLEACGIEFTRQIDGSSFVSVLKGERERNRKQVYTQFYETSGSKSYPMFAIHDADYVYIFNPWADGQTVFKNCSWAGMTFKAMEKSDVAEVKERLEFFKYRTKEELYDAKKDRDGLVNLIDESEYKRVVAKYRKQMEEWMISTGSWGIDLLDN